MSETDVGMELRAWRLLLEDDTYRLDFPEDYYATLIKRADELVLHEVIDLAQWQLLKDAADLAYERTLQGLERGERDCLNVGTLRLPEKMGQAADSPPSSLPDPAAELTESSGTDVNARR